MITQTKTKKEGIIIGLSIFAILMILISTIPTADSLSGKYFPVDSPIFANLYPNDFLPWIVFVFLLIGWMNTRFISTHVKSSHASIVAIVVVLVGFILMLLLSDKLENIWSDSHLQEVWAKYLSDLCRISNWAWFWGNYLAFFVYRYSRTDSANG